MRHLTRDEAIRVVTLLENGRSQRQVAHDLDIAQSVISRLWRRYQETGDVKRRRGQGRQRKTNVLEDRFLRLQALRNRFSTARALQNDILRARGCRISDQTVRNRLREFNIHSRRPAKVVRLTRNHRRARLLFAREHHNWQLRHWAKVLFTDESRFTLEMNDGRVRVWRRPHERFLPNTVQERVAYGGGSAMVWGGISINNRTDLLIIRDGGLTALRYINEVLETQVRHRAEAGGNNFLLMHDNARPHVARIVNAYREDNNIAAMEWPACSPDLNPIEHLWDQLSKAVRKKINPPVTVPQLEQALLEKW